jgi:hypothetical protein
MGFTNASSPMQALGNLVGGIATGQRQDPTGRALANASSTATAMYHALVQRGMPAETAVAVAQSVATNPKLAEAVLPQALGLKPPATMEAFFAEQADKAARSGQQFDPGQAYNNYLKFVQEKNAAEKAGTTQGERTANAQIDLPGAVSQAQEQIRLIEELRHHPGRNQPGWNDYLGKVPLIPGTKGYDAEVLLNQIKGGAFLEAFKTLKGGGQITEVEGKKATDAIARMDRAQTRAEFDKALTDYEGIIRLGIDRAAQMAGHPAPNGFRGNAAAPGTYDWTPGGGLRPRQ